MEGYDEIPRIWSQQRSSIAAPLSAKIFAIEITDYTGEFFVISLVDVCPPLGKALLNNPIFVAWQQTEPDEFASPGPHSFHTVNWILTSRDDFAKHRYNSFGAAELNNPSYATTPHRSHSLLADHYPF
jgi:hypothetical protein